MSGRPAGVVRALDGELLDRQPLVVRRFSPVDQPGKVTQGFAATLHLDRHAGDQQLVESPVGRQQRGDAQVPHLLQRVFPGSGVELRVQAGDGRTQALRHRHHDVLYLNHELWNAVVVPVQSQEIGAQGQAGALVAIVEGIERRVIVVVLDVLQDAFQLPQILQPCQAT